MKKTPLNSEHIKLGAKLVEFAGYEMPVHYAGIIDEHLAVRKSCGIFDVSHMGEFFVSGDGALDFLNHITINDVACLDIWQAQYSAMCSEDGGILDDILVYRYPDYFMLVVNCSNIEKNFDWIVAHKPENVTIADVSNQTGLIAIQGPNARAILNSYTDIDLNKVEYYRFSIANINGYPATVSRTGYTGELGFEIYADNVSTEKIWKILLSDSKYEIYPAGLGCRDTLRMEMKYVLYGNDIDQSTNPIEAGLGWITKMNKQNFIGKERLNQIKSNLSRELVCIEMIDKGIPRKGYPIIKDSLNIGYITSGTQSPSLQKGIGLAFINTDYSELGSELFIEVRNKHLKCKIIEAPFYKTGTVLD